MRNIITHIALSASLLLMACNSVKNIYTSENVSDRQLDKLVKNYLKNPNDTAASNRVVYAYQFIQETHLNKIQTLQQNNSLQSLEKLIGAYDDLQSFYNQVNQYPQVSRLVHPGNVTEEKQQALQQAAAAWYDRAGELLENNDWQSGREAYGIYRKVNNWVPGYRDTHIRIKDAMELGTIDAVIEPLHSEGFFYSGQYNRGAEQFTRQLVNDLSGKWNNDQLYRAYAAPDAMYNQVQADWIIEPVITRMQIDPVSYDRSTRTVTKQIETGKDSLKNPVYKTISAVLTIVDASVCASTDIEARIRDAQTNNRVARRNFNESITMREVSATYTGDKNALSNEDWKLVNNRNQLRVDERWLRERLLEKIYPDVLGYLRNELR
jgi:hypothetical protein